MESATTERFKKNYKEISVEITLGDFSAVADVIDITWITISYNMAGQDGAHNNDTWTMFWQRITCSISAANKEMLRSTEQKWHADQFSISFVAREPSYHRLPNPFIVCHTVYATAKREQKNPLHLQTDCFDISAPNTQLRNIHYFHGFSSMWLHHFRNEDDQYSLQNHRKMQQQPHFVWTNKNQICTLPLVHILS